MEKEKKTYKVFGMVLEVRDAIFLSVQYATSLEEAINQAKLEFHRINPPEPGVDNSLLGFKVGLYSYKTVDDIVKENKVYNDIDLEKIALKHRVKEKEEVKKVKMARQPVEIKKVVLTEADIKNMVMREILETGDKKMITQNKGLLTDNDIKYLTAELAKKKK